MAISDKVTSIENHLSADYEGLTNLGIDLTGINKNIENIKPCLDTIWNNLPKVSDTGTEVTLSPTLKGKLGIVPKGNSSQEGEPTPSNPISIKSVTGNNNVVVHTKNLINVTGTNNGLNPQGVIQTGEYLGINEYIACKPSTAYAVTFQNDVEGATLYVGYKDSEGTFITRTGYSSARTFITPNNAYSMFFYLYKGGGFTTGGYVQLEYGNTPTSYVPYANQTKPLNLGDIEFNGIGNYNDKIFKAVNGNAVYDSLTSEQKALLSYGNWYKKNKIGTTNIGTITTIRSGTIFGVTKQYITQNIADMLSAGNTQSYDFFCNKVSKANGVANNYSGYLTYQTFLSMVDDNDTTTTLNEKLQGATIKYILATPTDTEITDTTLISQLEEIDKMQSYNGTTIITSTYDSNNAQMILEVSSLKGE